MLERLRFVIRRTSEASASGQGYEVRDADSGEVVGTASESVSGFLGVLRSVLGNRLLPISLEASEKPDDSLVFTLRRGWSFLRSRMEVRDSQDVLVGTFRSKHFSLKSGFHIHDKAGKRLARVTGDLLRCDYRLMTEDGTAELGRVTRHPDGLPGDGYSLEVNPDLSEQPLAKMLLLAATIAADLLAGSKVRHHVDAVTASG